MTQKNQRNSAIAVSAGHRKAADEVVVRRSPRHIGRQFLKSIVRRDVRTLELGDDASIDSFGPSYGSSRKISQRGLQAA